MLGWDVRRKMPNRPNNSKAWLVWLLFFFGGIFCLLAAQEGCYQKSVKLLGVVVAKKYTPGTSRVGSGTLSSRSYHSIKYRFTTPQGETKETWSDVLTQNWNKFHEGDPVEIEYLSATGDSRVADQTASAPVFFMIAVVLLAGGFIMRRSGIQS